MITDFQIELMLATGLIVWGYIVFVKLSQSKTTHPKRQDDLRAPQQSPNLWELGESFYNLVSNHTPKQKVVIGIAAGKLSEGTK